MVTRKKSGNLSDKSCGELKKQTYTEIRKFLSNSIGMLDVSNKIVTALEINNSEESNFVDDELIMASEYLTRISQNLTKATSSWVALKNKLSSKPKLRSKK